jgi:spermidine synthase
MEDIWYEEKTRNIIITHRVKKQIISTRSAFQKIDILDTAEYGRMLFLDNMAQSSELDEFIYHEMMVHPGLLTHTPIRNVCIIGGAEGATLREVLKHDPERVVMIDIDEELVGICREFLPEWSRGAFDDPRVDLKFMDGRKFLEETGERFDAILIDLSDPLENAPSTLLYTREFYERAKRCLSPEGCVLIQSETLNPNRIEPHARIHNTLGSLFSFVRPYFYLSHSFHEFYSFILASDAVDPAEIDVGPALEKNDMGLRYYSAELHSGMFRLPAYLRNAYETYPDLITDQDVVYYPDK